MRAGGAARVPGLPPHPRRRRRRYETTFRKEVLSDLYGERGVLMGAIQGAFAAQYEVLRAKVRRRRLGG